MDYDYVHIITILEDSRFFHIIHPKYALVGLFRGRAEVLERGRLQERRAVQTLSPLPGG